MTLICSFQIPGEPTGKGRPRMTTRGGKLRSFTPEKTVSYESLTIAAFRSAHGGGRLIESPVRVMLCCRFTMPASWSEKKRKAHRGDWCCKKPDADNIAKAVCDALNGVLWRDDSQVASLVVEKLWADCGSVLVDVFV